MASSTVSGHRVTHRAHPRIAQGFLLVALAVVAVVLLLTAWREAPEAVAQTTQTGGEPDGVFAVAGQLTARTYGLFLVDAKRGAVAIYEYVPNERKFHLRAARNITYDLQLESYNTEPAPGEIADLVRQARKISDRPPAPRPRRDNKE